MKNYLCSVALSALVATNAYAGGLADPVVVMEPVEIVEATTPSSSANLIVPLIIIAFLAAAASSSGGGGGSDLALGSDERIKTDIVPVATHANGLTIYQYRYIGSDTVFEGVMAQDVLMHTPSAVVTYPSGLMAVNYGALGLSLRVID